MAFLCIFASFFPPQHLHLLTLQCGCNKVQYLRFIDEQTDHQGSEINYSRSHGNPSVVLMTIMMMMMTTHYFWGDTWYLDVCVNCLNQ